ncbi:MAG: glycosyltransferase family 2 protein [Acidobacteriota bacterium]|nr:glycosyltransferase family 2 protein [Acidobacteriota bacterium]
MARNPNSSPNSNHVPEPQISVLMPTYNQASFLRRAVGSLLAQTYTNWELFIIDDGSTDETPTLISQLRSDARIRDWRLDENCGFGCALNRGLAAARSPLVTYLPSDDVYFPRHLASLKDCLDAHPNASLAYSGLRFQHQPTALGHIPGFGLQLVQVMHRRGEERWIERQELVSDDLERLFWNQLRPRGPFVGTEQVSAEWVAHPQQHHKVIRENLGGGLNVYRSRYGVKHPLRFHSSVGSYTDEVAQYSRFRERPATPAAPNGLKILLVGELAFNPDRVLALEERGHRLYGLWTEDPWWLNTVGPLPFGHVQDIPRSDWRNAVRELQPDIIYALLNWQAVPFAHEVLRADLGIPFVWHFKEGPWLCLQHGYWPQMVDLHTRTDGQIYTSPELRDWFETILPGCTKHGRTMILDGDLPKREWFEGAPSPRLSESDGEFHTVVPGRPIGLHPGLLRDLPEQHIHLHFYGDLQHQDWKHWVEEAQRVAPGYFHLHPHVGPAQWVTELSHYDAGWLHFLKSDNNGDLGLAFWDDLNYPARVTTLMAAGLPLLQYENEGAVVATQTLARRLGIGLFCQNMAQLGSQLRDTNLMSQIRNNVRQHRPLFTFDYHADELLAFFARVIEERKAPSFSADTRIAACR